MGHLLIARMVCSLHEDCGEGGIFSAIWRKVAHVEGVWGRGSQPMEAMWDRPAPLREPGD